MTGPVRNPNYRPGNANCVFVTGLIDERCAEQISRSVVSAPTDQALTVYIDSRGGSTYYAERIYDSLKRPDQDSGESRHILTVGLGLAASAACDLLIAGDYALAYPTTTILCHGVRLSADGLTVTRETAVELAENLAGDNERFAMQTARNAISRFIFRFLTQRHTVDAVRAQENAPAMPEPDCFIFGMDSGVSKSLSGLLHEASIDKLQSDAMDARVRKAAAAQGISEDDQTQFEALILKTVIDYQIGPGLPDTAWSFSSGGLRDTESKFQILRNSHNATHRKQIEILLERWGEFLLSDREKVAYLKISKAQKQKWLAGKVTPLLRSLWFLFVSICRRLQRDEHTLSAEEAWRIGLIDEVIGRSDLPSPRQWAEFAATIDLPPAPDDPM